MLLLSAGLNAPQQCMRARALTKLRWTLNEASHRYLKSKLKIVLDLRLDVQLTGPRIDFINQHLSS